MKRKVEIEENNFLAESRNGLNQVALHQPTNPKAAFLGVRVGAKI